MLWIVRKIFQRLLLGCNWILFDFITTYSVSVSLYSGLTSLFQLTFILFTFTLPRSALYIFCSIRVFFTDTDDSQGSRGREGTIFYLTLPLSPAHEHWDIYLQLCMWDDYYALLIATLVFTRLLLDEIYHFIKLPFQWLMDDTRLVCLLDELILGFCYSDLKSETGGFELASAITLVLQAKRLTKYASHILWER